jgi:predicted TIM-barrel fold metal-dependent hydrolase
MSVHIPVLDTHQHLIYPEKHPCSWTGGIPQLAGRAFRYDDYLKAIQGTGITETIFMESGVDDPYWREETPFLHSLANTANSMIKGIIGSCRPEQESGFAAYVESVLSPKLVGFRRMLHVEPDDLSQRSAFTANIRVLEKYNLTFDLCVLARQIPLATALAAKCPGVQFILDHCGVPDVASGQLDPWRKHISEIASFHNVACKISGVIAYCAPGQITHEAVRPYVEHCLDQFGWDRVVWGSDWPVCTQAASLSTWVNATWRLIATADECDRRKLMHDNAVRIYNVKEQCN